MELRNKGTVQNVTNIKSNVCFCCKCILNIYVQLHIGTRYNRQWFAEFFATVFLIATLVKKPAPLKNCWIRHCWRFFPLSWKLVTICMCIPKIGSLLCVDCGILNLEFFFHMQHGIFIPKRLRTSHSCCFKASEAIEVKPKRMEYFIFSALSLPLSLSLSLNEFHNVMDTKCDHWHM